MFYFQGDSVRSNDYFLMCWYLVCIIILLVVGRHVFCFNDGGLAICILHTKSLSE